MAAPILPDESWDRVEPLLPPVPARRSRFPGRKPLTHRQALTGILFVLRTGTRWNDLPAEMGCGSGSRRRRRLAEWRKAGVWDRPHEVLLAEPHAAGKIDWSRAAIDSSSCRARGGGEDTGRNPTDRGKSGTKRHIIVDANGVPPPAQAQAARVVRRPGL